MGRGASCVRPALSMVSQPTEERTGQEGTSPRSSHPVAAGRPGGNCSFLKWFFPLSRHFFQSAGDAETRPGAACNPAPGQTYK